MKQRLIQSCVALVERKAGRILDKKRESAKRGKNTTGRGEEEEG